MTTLRVGYPCNVRHRWQDADERYRERERREAVEAVTAGSPVVRDLPRCAPAWAPRPFPSGSPASAANSSSMATRTL
jgi:hypothetical protein